MKASVIDLRYRMSDVIKALFRNEPVEIFYHRKKIGVITSVSEGTKLLKNVQEHPFFGSATTDELSVEDVMQKLRGGRY